VIDVLARAAFGGICLGLEGASRCWNTIKKNVISFGLQFSTFKKKIMPTSKNKYRFVFISFGLQTSEDGLGHPANIKYFCICLGINVQVMIWFIFKQHGGSAWKNWVLWSTTWTSASKGHQIFLTSFWFYYLQ